MSRNKPQIGARELMAPERLAYPVALGVTLLLVACVGEADGDKPTNQQQEELAEAICEMRVECCGEFYDDSNRDTCRATRVSLVGAYFNRVETAVDRGDAEYDAGEFDACASALNDASCSEWIALESGDWPTACRELVRGSLSDGSGCEDHFDCLSGWCDEQEDSASKLSRVQRVITPYVEALT